MAPAKVLIVIDRLGRGGVSQVAMNVALSLDRDRFAPTVCVTRDKPAYGHDTMLKQAGIPLIELKRKSRLELFSWRPLWRALSDTTILHSHLSGSNFWGRLWGKLYRVPIIITQEHAPAYEKRWYERLVDRWLSPLSDRIIAVSEFDRQQYVKLEKIPPEKIETVYVGIDVDKFSCQMPKQEAKRLAGAPPDKQIISVIARLFPQKNHRGFLEALALLPPNLLSSIHCLLIGSGPLEAELRNQAERLGLQDVVSFLGERTDVPALLWATDVVALPSHFECLPSVISEAMAAQCAVVATAVGGVPEMLDGVGWPLVQPGDSEELARAITQVLTLSETERRQFAARGRELVIERFSKSESVARTEQLYQSLLDSVGNRSV